MSDVEVIVGTVGKPHGLRGEVTVTCRTDEPDRRFAVGQQLRVGNQRRIVASSRWHQGTLLVGFEGVADRTNAEVLRGADVWARVPHDESPAEPEEYYDRQLVGLRVRDARGEVVGEVNSVAHLPAQDHLIVATRWGLRSIPFVSALVPVVDLAAGVVELADVPGLLNEAEQV